MPEKNNKWNLLCLRAEMTHQYYFNSSEASSIKFYEKQTSKYNPFSNPQDNGFETSFKNVGNQKSNVIGVQQKKPGLSFSEKNITYCRMSPTCNKLSDRSGFQCEKGRPRIETKSSDIRRNVQNSWNAKHSLSYQLPAYRNHTQSVLQEMKCNNKGPKIFMHSEHFA